MSALRSVSERLLAAQFPVLSWWAMVTVLTRAVDDAGGPLDHRCSAPGCFKHGTVTIGEIVTFMALAGMVITRLEQAVSFANRMALDAAAPARVLRHPRHRAGAARQAGRHRSRARCRDASNLTMSHLATTAYGPRSSGLTFTAEPGETVALVGATGAGKSTALALLHRAFDPQSGSIRIDGTDIRDIQLGALRRNIGVVFQEALLFNRSIAENMRVGKPDASHDECAMPLRVRKHSISSTQSGRL